MAFDGNGNWVSNYSAVAQRDADLPILASNFDNILLADLATSFENCLTKDMQIKPQGNFDANRNRVINVADPVNDRDAVNLATLKSIWPVGSIYIGTQNTCPLSSLIVGSTWELVAQDRALWGGDGTNANTTIAAGLPKPTITSNATTTQRVKTDQEDQTHWVAKGEQTATITVVSDSIYGNSDTVQPPAYRVNVWRRTA